MSALFSIRCRSFCFDFGGNFSFGFGFVFSHNFSFTIALCFNFSSDFCVFSNSDLGGCINGFSRFNSRFWCGSRFFCWSHSHGTTSEKGCDGSACKKFRHRSFPSFDLLTPSGQFPRLGTLFDRRSRREWGKL